MAGHSAGEKLRRWDTQKEGVLWSGYFLKPVTGRAVVRVLPLVLSLPDIDARDRLQAGITACPVPSVRISDPARVGDGREKPKVPARLP
ncbi:hypothetical protein ES703_64879 [subsurface metagenome]